MDHAFHRLVCMGSASVDHIDHCLVHAEAGEGAGSAVEEFRTISKYL
jgi:hypothetical protein